MALDAPCLPPYLRTLYLCTIISYLFISNPQLDRRSREREREMADLTHGAVDSLLGVLSAAIKDEAQLLGGVKGDIQFIKDEMDSMNGFLLHLNKSGDDHDDQQRAWMKQVREIAHIAQDCIELYMRDLAPPDPGFWAQLRHVVVRLRTMPARHQLATKIRDLKVRVRDVGERRQRYGVTVPEVKRGRPAGVHGGKTAGELSTARDEFLRALALDMDAGKASFENAIALLPEDFKSATEAIQTALAEGQHEMDQDSSTICSMEMLLRALHVSPQGQGRVNKEELDNLRAASESDSGTDLPKQVMVLCYSKLSRDYKSCLQYLTAFLEEKSISRTSLVRRWAAERLVAKEDDKQSYEQAAEMCFSDLLFRGFISPADHGAAGKVKSCKMRDQVKKFVSEISKSENFEGSHLPTHLDNQLRIRHMVAKQQKKLEQKEPEQAQDHGICGLPIPGKKDEKSMAAADSKKLQKSIDKQLNHLRSLPKTYRLNVMDLGGCRGLKKRHLKSICKLLTLKYLSLRYADVSGLPSQIQALQLLETLDIRQTKIRGSDTKHITLRKLKHLLAGDNNPSRDGESICTMRMPANISKMTDMEVLSRVEISHGNELSEVGSLKKLRKLGVLLPGREQDIKDLRREIFKVLGRLCSLSIWIKRGTLSEAASLDKDERDGIFQPPRSLESLSINGMDKSGLPSWVAADLSCLSKITLCDTHLTAQKLENVVSKLPGLLCLRLRRGSYKEDVLAFSTGGFKALRFLLLEGASITKLTFEENSGPQIEKIVWSMMNADVAAKASATGIEHLGGLKQLVLPEDHSCPLVEDAIAKHPKSHGIRRSY
ncbi:hypothetical protein GQ55_3G406000 [Panicum hallii var. hallii]|uniref:Uncharacterized protein n=1 Tax=Panicum hallii var. hallii TaxID=1504633 RepID=A0A2T7EH07_9POAL|nr:hypothetical protein GQ55_3G406000 [Panicum hallii var. hallii]